MPTKQNPTRRTTPPTAPPTAAAVPMVAMHDEELPELELALLEPEPPELPVLELEVMHISVLLAPEGHMTHSNYPDQEWSK